MSHLGDLLKAEREKKGIRLSDISSVTKIPLNNLKLIEEGNWEHLPPPPFIKGFLTSYCRFVGLSPNDTYKLYLAETQKQEEAPVAVDSASEQSSAPENHRLPASEIIAHPKVFKIKPIAFSILGVLGVVLSFWLIRLGRQEMVSPAVSVAVVSSPPPVAEDPAPSPNREPASSATVEAPPPVSEKSPHELQVTPKERTWVKIVIDEAPPVEYFLNPSEKTKYSAKEKIKLVLGNSAGAEVLHNGEPTEGVKFQGTIRSFIFPPQAKFPQDKPARKLTEEDLPGESDSSAGEFILE